MRSSGSRCSRVRRRCSTAPTRSPARSTSSPVGGPKAERRSSFAAGERGHFGASGAYNYVDPDNDLELFIGASGFYDSGYEQTFEDEAGVVGKYDEYQTRSNLNVRVKYDIHELRFSGVFNEESNLGVVPRFSRGADEPHRVEAYTSRYDISGKVHRHPDQLSAGAYFDYGRREHPSGLYVDGGLHGAAQQHRGLSGRHGGVRSVLEATPWLVAGARRVLRLPPQPVVPELQSSDPRESDRRKQHGGPKTSTSTRSTRKPKSISAR